MTITIPTGDLVGLISDVVPFGYPDAELPKMHCVRLEWDGTLLHAMALDGVRIAWGTWSPDDEHEKEHQDSLFTKWGSGDEPWSATIDLDDAKDLAKVFKLGAKEQYVPLTIEKVGRAVKVVRSRESGHSAITTVMEDTFVEFADIRKMLAEHDVAIPVSGTILNAKYLADFAKVRPRGPMRLTFTGDDRAILVAIGERFAGAIKPIRDADKAKAGAQG